MDRQLAESLPRRRSGPTWVWAALLAAIGLPAALLAFASCRVTPAETVRLAAPALEQNALIYLAERQGFFARQNLNVVIGDCESGVTALKRLSAGEADIAAAAEFPVASALCAQSPLAIIASYDRFENDYLIARMDRGIVSPADLKGKRIGVALGTINEFFLGRFLQLHGIDPDGVVLVDVHPGRYAAAIGDGMVDALIAWQPYVRQITVQEGGRVLVWPAQSSQTVYGLLACQRAWADAHPDTVRRFLRALFEAERDLLRNPARAQAVVQARMKYPPHYLTEVWPKHRFALTLDQALIVAMKDEARWLMVSGRTAAPVMPDFTSCVDAGALNAVKPYSVRIIR